jgi:AcrR family transcriptional regulator
VTASPAKRPGTATAPARRPRDAAMTRRLLLDVALRRFAVDGYAATTVRDIADEAGVNVALISRYFTSKEGLFEACLSAVHEEMRQTAGEVTLAQVPEAIAAQVAGLGREGFPNRLALLLRSSGDERADEIRFGVLRTSAERLAEAAGWRPGAPEGDRMILRAQMVLAATLGVAMLRSSTTLSPLTTATEQDLVAPLRDLVDALLT